MSSYCRKLQMAIERHQQRLHDALSMMGVCINEIHHCLLEVFSHEEAVSTKVMLSQVQRLENACKKLQHFMESTSENDLAMLRQLEARFTSHHMLQPQIYPVVQSIRKHLIDSILSHSKQAPVIVDLVRCVWVMRSKEFRAGDPDVSVLLTSVESKIKGLMVSVEDYMKCQEEWGYLYQTVLDLANHEASVSDKFLA